MELLPHVLQCHPIVGDDFVRAAGVFLYDNSGRGYIDFESGIWCTALGHSHPRISECMTSQMHNIIHLAPQYTSKLAEEAAQALLRHTPYPDGKAIFLSSGSEAVEFAIRLATLYTGRTNISTFSRSYFGAYGRNERYNWTEIDLDVCLECQREACDFSCDQLKRLPETSLAAFVLEPVLGSGGVIIPPAKAVRFLSKTVADSGGLLVANEVTTGLGRTGQWLGVDHFDLSPDIIAFGKILGNGYPISAVAVKKSIANRIEESGFQYIQSHQNDPLGCAIAKEVIAVLEQDDLVSRSRRLGEYFKKRLQETAGQLDAVSQVRGTGLMLGLQLKPECFESSHEIEEIAAEMRYHGYVIGIKPQLFLLRFMPPFIIDEDLISGMCSYLIEVLDKRCKK
jgi:acetylornithine/N-succinyldiaminopimelate aminotransferase